MQSSDFVPLECALSDDLQEYTYYMCQAYYIDFDFVMALMFTESSFRTDVVSKTNDYGLMQINKMNHEWLSKKLGITDFLDPYQNMKAGCYVLSKLIDSCDGNITKAEYTLLLEKFQELKMELFTLNFQTQQLKVL